MADTTYATALPPVGDVKFIVPRPLAGEELTEYVAAKAAPDCDPLAVREIARRAGAIGRKFSRKNVHAERCRVCRHSCITARNSAIRQRTRRLGLAESRQHSGICGDQKTFIRTH